MVTRYDNLKSEEEAIKRFVKLGLIDYTVQRNILIFEQFNMHPELCALCRYEVLSVEHKISAKSIEKIVLDLKKEDIKMSA